MEEKETENRPLSPGKEGRTMGSTPAKDGIRLHYDEFGKGIQHEGLQRAEQESMGIQRL